jgi:hypothetical protein
MGVSLAGEANAPTGNWGTEAARYLKRDARGDHNYNTIDGLAFPELGEVGSAKENSKLAEVIQRA